MSKKTSADTPRIVKKSEYIPEIETRLVQYIESIKDSVFERNTTLYIREKSPKFDNYMQKEEWEREQIRRCRDGHNGMCGKMYFWFNFCFIQNLSGGKIPPQFRVCDHEWYKLIEDCQESCEFGVVCVKRRRCGMSWKEAADMIHDCIFNPFFYVGVNSKSERDSVILFNKVKFIYDNLPSFLRVAVSSKTRMKMEFSIDSKDENGNKIKIGTQSSILCVAPTDSAFEGMMLGKWVADEAGKTENLPQMWSFTEDCLMQETRRVGVPILFGTSGEVDKAGRGLMNMWDQNKAYNLKRFFFAGYMGLICDEYGNDDLEEAIRWILYERHRRGGLDEKSRNDFLQRYPLTVEEAFAMYNSSGVGDPVKINAQISSLRENPAASSKGFFRIGRDGEDEVVFVPSDKGSVIIWEHPKGMKDLYIAGCDPADHDDPEDGASNMSLFVYQRQNGPEPPKLVAEYTDRPSKANDFYEQSLFILKYYKSKCLIENNRYRMISFFDENWFKHLLARTPQGIVRMFGGAKTNNMGLRMTESTRVYMEGLIEEYIDDYYDLIPSRPLLEEFLQYGPVNTDRVYAFGMCLMLAKEWHRRNATSYQENIHLPSFRYKNVNGRIVRVSDR